MDEARESFGNGASDKFSSSGGYRDRDISTDRNVVGTETDCEEFIYSERDVFLSHQRAEAGHCWCCAHRPGGF